LPPGILARPDENRGNLMSWLIAAAAALAFGAVAGFTGAERAADEPPPWAYGFDASLDNTTLYTLPGSKFSFTQSQIFNRYGPADWFPEDHPTMPEIVAHGRETAAPTISACGSCHYPNGRVVRRTPTSPGCHTNISCGS
jgi:hypothetical protein